MEVHAPAKAPESHLSLMAVLLETETLEELVLKPAVRVDSPLTGALAEVGVPEGMVSMPVQTKVEMEDWAFPLQ